MAESVYRLWLDDEKMQRGRQAYEKGKLKHDGFFCILYGLLIIFLFAGAVTTILIFELYFSTSDIFSIIIFSFSGSILFVFIHKIELICYSRFQRSDAYMDWTKQYKAKAFGDKFVKRAVKAGCDPQTAVDAMVPFLAAGDISYQAFDGYCRKKQEELEREPAEASAKKQQEYERRRVKAAAHLQKKFLTPADGAAEQ